MGLTESNITQPANKGKLTLPTPSWSLKNYDHPPPPSPPPPVTYIHMNLPPNYARQSRPLQNIPIAHRLLNKKGGRRPRKPRFAQSSRVLKVT